MSGFAGSVARPNILVTGTPGTGKTTTSEAIASAIGFKVINVGDVVKEYQCFEGKDEEFDSYILDEDKLLDQLEIMLEGGGFVVDFHTCEIFPERWFELVLCLRTETHVLFDRLSQRGYNEKKISENMECEIMQVVLDAATESYDPNIVQEIPNNSLQDIESTVARVHAWLEAWKVNNRT